MTYCWKFKILKNVWPNFRSLNLYPQVCYESIKNWSKKPFSDEYSLRWRSFSQILIIFNNCENTPLPGQFLKQKCHQKTKFAFEIISKDLNSLKRQVIQRISLHEITVSLEIVTKWQSLQFIIIPSIYLIRNTKILCEGFRKSFRYKLRLTKNHFIDHI